MIIWSGRGILSIVVLVASFIGLMYLLPEGQSDYVFILSFFIAGAFSWFFGKRWNGHAGTMMVDEETGENILVKPNHSIFWIKMQYWGPIFGLIGLLILIQQFT